jgi:Tfp pilus assembly protein PilX
MEIDQGLKNSLKNENGFALLGTLLILVLLIIIGLVASTNTNLELQIAGNDRIHKETFYQADGGAQIGIRLVEESVGNAGPFTTLNADSTLRDPVNPNNTILVVDTQVAINAVMNRFATSGIHNWNRDLAYFPGGYNAATAATDPHTNIIVDGATTTVAGAGLQMIAGYEGKGKGTAGGGTQILYSIYSQHVGRVQSESTVKVDWRHVVGLELENRY